MKRDDFWIHMDPMDNPGPDIGAVPSFCLRCGARIATRIDASFPDFVAIHNAWHERVGQ